ncbi:plant invertase/pectin methylesterase inhibitor [Striga asiatica]|uniref:Pectinesterase n=1 Tax=Striga asiatica TaxID=4170 RepID=A0A5A7QY49_STRAF|nr:plant invertase/pectin methylesterase inhibitor [Striga asiatica]
MLAKWSPCEPRHVQRRVRGHNSQLKTLISGSLEQIISSVGKLLSMVSPESNPPADPSKGDFPDWLKPDDRKLLQSPGSRAANAVVAADGTGNFTSIQAAVQAAPEHSRMRFVIYVKRGVYMEYVHIDKKKWNIMLVGDGIDTTVISGSRSYAAGWTTFSTPTFSKIDFFVFRIAASGRGFIARDLTFENTAGPEKHQAVAFRSESDLSVLYRCGFRGFQDTLYPHNLRQFYRECKITGTVDFIFGHGTVVFQNCEMVARKGLPNQKNTVTANGRSNLAESSGFSIQFCNITGEPELMSAPGSNPTYLGRPWRKYSRTVVMESYISNVVRAEGWLEWDKSFALDTLYYGEYKNYGPGSGLVGRVNWAGYHVINDPGEADKFTVAQFINGNNWLPSTGVRYTAGLEM